MSSGGGPTVDVKLFINKEKKKVLFAEADKDFVDVLFSFLTLPLGTIVRRLGKQSQIGCLDELYKSVESLGLDHFQTTACRTMLLSPVNAAAFYCDRLQVKVDDTSNGGYYICPTKLQLSAVEGSCNCKADCRASFFESSPNSVVTAWDNEDGVFVKSGLKFIITDDLQVAPSSTSLVFSLFDKLGIEEQFKLEEKVFILNSNKMTTLLKNALMSKQPLTGLCFDVATSTDALYLDQLLENLPHKGAYETKTVFKPIKIKLVQTDDNSSVLYAEVGGDFVDILFGLLCVPLGSIINTFGEWSPNGCIENLDASVDGGAKTCMKQGCQSLLRTPKLAAFFGCSRNVLPTEELSPKSMYISCFGCRSFSIRCSCPYPYSGTFSETNPKSPVGGSDNTAKAYVKGGLRNFLVTDDLRVLHFSLANTLQVMRAAKISKENLVEKELTRQKPGSEATEGCYADSRSTLQLAHQSCLPRSRGHTCTACQSRAS